MTRPDDERGLDGVEVAITGRMASMSREEAVELLARAGARYVREPGPATDLLVLGRSGPPLGEDGRLTRSLRAARELAAGGSGIEIVQEDELLVRLGLEDRQVDLHRLYTAEQLGRILGIPRGRIAAWVRQGLLCPERVHHRLLFFDFQQVASARALDQLTRAGVTPARIRASLEQLAAWSDAPANALSWLESLAGTLCVRRPDGRLAEPTGQLRLDFENEQVSGPAPEVAIAPRPDGDGADWFEVGQTAELEERLEDAAEAYAQARRRGDSRPEVAFNLGNVLFTLGRHGDSAAAFLQAAEADPTFVEAWNNLGSVLHELGRHREAVLAYSKALAVAPDYADAHFNLAETLAALGDLVGARRHWRRYLEEDPASPTAAEVRRRLSEQAGA